jgi:hypothetical protein
MGPGPDAGMDRTTHLRGGKVSGSGTIAADQGGINLAPGTGACAVPRDIGPHGTSKVPCL